MKSRIIALALLLCASQAHAAGSTYLYDSTLPNTPSIGSGSGGVPLPVTLSPSGSTGNQVAPSAGTLTNRSGTITTGGTSQTLAAANASRKQLVVQNPCNATEDLFINATAAASTSAAANLADLAPCGAYVSSGEFVTSEQINVTAATTGHAFSAKEGQ